MDVALAVVEQIDCFADRLPCLFHLCQVFQLSGDAFERPTADPQANVRVRPDGPNPSCDSSWAVYRQLGGAELDNVGLAPSSDNADALASRLPGLAPGRRDQSEAGRRPRHEEREHQGT